MAKSALVDLLIVAGIVIFLRLGTVGSTMTVEENERIENARLYAASAMESPEITLALGGEDEYVILSAGKARLRRERLAGVFISPLRQNLVMEGAAVEYCVDGEIAWKASGKTAIYKPGKPLAFSGGARLVPAAGSEAADRFKAIAGDELRIYLDTGTIRAGSAAVELPDGSKRIEALLKIDFSLEDFR